MDLTLFHQLQEEKTCSVCESGVHCLWSIHLWPGHRVGIAGQGAASREAGSWYSGLLVGQTPQKGSALSSCLWAQSWRVSDSVTPKCSLSESF